VQNAAASVPGGWLTKIHQAACAKRMEGRAQWQNL